MLSAEAEGEILQLKQDCPIFPIDKSNEEIMKDENSFEIHASQVAKMMKKQALIGGIQMHLKTTLCISRNKLNH